MTSQKPTRNKSPEQVIISKITKADIAKSFKEMEQQGAIVLNFGDNRKGRRAVTGKADVEVLHKCFAVIEIKVRKDKFSEEQINYGLKFLDIFMIGAFYLIATENNYQAIKIALLQCDTVGLDIYQQQAKKYLKAEQTRLNNLKLKRK